MLFPLLDIYGLNDNHLLFVSVYGHMHRQRLLPVCFINVRVGELVEKKNLSHKAHRYIYDKDCLKVLV